MKKRFAFHDWVDVSPPFQAGGQTYKEGTPPYQEGGWSPLWALAGQGATSVGKDVMCQAAKRFRQSFCQKDEDEAPPRKKKKKKTTQQGGVQPLVSWLDQLGAGGNTYRAGTEPYQEGGILPLLASLFSSQRGMGKQKGGFLGPIIEPIGDLIKMGFQKKAAQRGRGAGRQKGGFLGPIIEPIGDLIKMGFQKKAAQRGRGASGSKKKKKRSKYITGSSVLDPQTTLNRLFRRAGQRPIGVLPDVISGPQVGMGRRRRRPCRSHCFQGVP